MDIKDTKGRIEMIMCFLKLQVLKLPHSSLSNRTKNGEWVCGLNQR
jgi:hypothetical protein